MIRPVIAIDGPAGAGKSTIAKMVAERLDYVYIDTGAMYRAVTLKFLATKKAFNDELVTKIAQDINITFREGQGCNRVYIDNQEVTEEIRSTKVTKNVSKISAVGGVRDAMVSAQREIGVGGGVVMDGRDIGTVVFPQAEVKVFLTASVEERAKRRYLELKNKGQNIKLEVLAQEIALRDKLDSERKLSPLRCAENAHYLDTSDLDIPTVVDNILRLCKVS